MQSDEVDCCSMSFLGFTPHLGFNVSPQLAALKLIDSGMIALDTAVGDYLPEFRNPIVVDRTSTQKTAFRPAKAVVTVKHLLNSSSGLFYPVMVEDMLGLHEGYKSKDMHQAADPVAQFFRIVIVSQFHFGRSCIPLLMFVVLFARGNCPLCR